jgi:hypothetical protein
VRLLNILHAHLVWDADGTGRFGRDVTTPWVQDTYDAIEQLLCVVSPVWTHANLFREAVTHTRVLTTPLLRNRLNEVRPGLAMLRRFYVGKFPAMDTDSPVSPDEPCNEIYLPPLSTGHIYRCRTYSHSCVAGAALAKPAFFTLVDVKAAFNSIEMSEDAAEKAAVITMDNLFRIRRLPFGLRNGPATFNRAMARVFQDFESSLMVS